MSNATLTFAAKHSPDEENASSILTLAYSALRQMLESYCLLEGYKVYSHEAYTHYLFMKQLPVLAERFDRLRKLRNKAEYEGKRIKTIIAKEAIKEVEDLLLQLENSFI